MTSGSRIWGGALGVAIKGLQVLLVKLHFSNVTHNWYIQGFRLMLETGQNQVLRLQYKQTQTVKQNEKTKRLSEERRKIPPEKYPKEMEISNLPDKKIQGKDHKVIRILVTLEREIQVIQGEIQQREDITIENIYTPNIEHLNKVVITRYKVRNPQ